MRRHSEEVRRRGGEDERRVFPSSQWVCEGMRDEEVKPDVLCRLSQRSLTS